MTDAELDMVIADLKGIDIYTHSINAQAVADEAADVIATLREQVAAKDAEIADIFHGNCIATQRAEKAEADNAALRQDKEWLLHNAGAIGAWSMLWSPKIHGSLMDYLRSRVDAALLAGKEGP